MIRTFTLILISISTLSCGNNSFKPDIWKRNQNEQFLMLNDLIESEILINKSKEEVIALLDTTGIKQYNYSDSIWMFIISKPQPTLATESPMVILDVTFHSNNVITAEKRK